MVTDPVGLSTWFGRLRGAPYRTTMFGKFQLHPDRGVLRNNVGLVEQLGFDVSTRYRAPRAPRRLPPAL